ncbi:MAG: hypothetical protein P8J14_06430 [Emcibacteraceae bacterium]|nr:hypothetical protein [Emcibacteraceae bacterium]
MTHFYKGYGLDNLVAAFKLGQDAKSCGRSARDNQYGATTVESRAWLRGFNCA